MVKIAEGAFVDLLVEEHPVTNAQFRNFVISSPAWLRSQAAAVLVGENYLQHWLGDFEYPEGSANSPVTNVSWFAAREYARWAGRRLATQDEWESLASLARQSPMAAKRSAISKPFSTGTNGKSLRYQRQFDQVSRIIISCSICMV